MVRFIKLLLVTFVVFCCQKKALAQKTTNVLQQIATKKSTANWLELKPTTNLKASQLIGEYKTAFGLSDDDDLQFLKSKTDNLGYTHQRFRQFYAGVEVEGAVLVVHERNGRVEKVNGHLSENISINITPTLNEFEAIEQALFHIDATAYAWENADMERAFQIYKGDSDASFYPTAKLVVLSPDFSPELTDFKLVYKFDIYANSPHGRWHIYIDAHTGDEILRISQICSACENTAVCTGESHHNGTSNIQTDFFSGKNHTRDCEREILTYNAQNSENFYSNDSDLFQDSDCNFINEQQKAGVDVHWATAQAYDYFNETFMCPSVDCNGSVIQNWVHFGEEIYNNAFYNGIGFAYGDGDGLAYNPFTSLDVVAHEFTHGITHHSAGLIYAYEAGALNESFSDIFAAVIEYLKHNSNSSWQADEHWEIGEQITINGGNLAGVGLRNMQDPNMLNDPNTYEGNFWQNQVNCFSGWWNDNCGVHTNSGVQNHWFYLLSEGGNGTNDHDFDYAVSGIGIENAARIAYRSLSHYLTPTSTYFDARQAAIWAAEDLFGMGSSEVQSVQDAWCAVGLGTCNGSSIVLTKPNGGEVLDGGTIYEIAWNSNTIEAAYVKLTYSADNGLSWKSITNNVENDGNYDWFVPNILSNTVLVRLQDANNAALMDVSDAVFTIDGCGTEAYFELADSLLNASTLPIICQGESSRFNNFSTGSTHFEWLINDEIAIYEEEFSHTFDKLTGTYTNIPDTSGNVKNTNYQKISLRGVQMQGQDTLCMSLFYRYIYIIPQPNADFSMSLHNLEATFYAPLVAHEDDNTTFYTWDLGDGTTSNETRPIHNYSTLGTYNVCLTMQNNCNSETICKDIEVSVGENDCDGSWANYANMNDVKDMIAQNESVLWIATSGGLVYYNNVTGSTIFYNSANSNLIGNEIAALDYRASDNSLWILVQNAGLCKFDISNNEFSKIELPATAAIFENYNTSDLKIDNQNNVWACASTVVLKVVNATDEVIVYNSTNSSLPQSYFSQIETDSQNNIWLLSSNYVIKLSALENMMNQNNWLIYSPLDVGMTPNSQFLAVFPDETHDKVWLRVQSSVYSMIELRGNGVHTVYPTFENMTNASESDVWFSRSFQLFHFENGVKNEYNMPATLDYKKILLTENKVFTKRQASNGVDALVSFDKNTADTHLINITNVNSDLQYNKRNQIREMALHQDYGMLLNGSDGCYFFEDNLLHAPNNYFEIMETDGNKTWFANYNMLFEYSIENLALIPIDFPQENGNIRSLATYQNTVFVGTTNGLYEYNPADNSWISYNVLRPQNANVFWNIVDIIIHNRNDIWLAAGSGSFYHWNGVFWSWYNENNTGMSSNYAYCIAEDHEHNLWFGTTGGLTKFDGTNWTHYNAANSGIAGNSIKEIKTHSNGDIWVLTNNGLSYFDGTNWKNYKSETSGLPTNNLASIEIDDAGNLYVGGESGGGLGILYNGTGIVPSFSANSESVCKEQHIFFSSTSTVGQGNINYTWLVDGIEMSNASFLYHLFLTEGTHIVALIVDNGICENSFSQSVMVTPNTYDAVVDIQTVGCGDGTVTLDSNIDNVAAYSWQFNGIEIGDSRTIEVSEIGFYVLMITDHCGASNSYFVEVVLDDDCVFAGDANYDGICNNYDALAIGVAFQEGGPARAVHLTNWQGYYCNDWQGVQADSTNFKHADCNGNGMVNSDDFDVISQNYGETHDFSPNTPVSISSPIQLVADQSAISFSEEQNTFSVPIDLQNVVGNEVATAGLAFNIEFAVSGANLTNANLHFENSDLGNNSEVLSISKFFPDLSSTTSGRLETALIRKDKSDINTQQIAELEVNIANISSAEPLELMIQVEAGAKMISNNYILPINATTSNIVIDALPIVCDIPTNLYESDLTSSGVTLNWDDMSAEKYRLVGRKSTSTTWKVFDPQTENFRAFTSGLQSNTCYEWTVKAKCDGVWTAWQEIREFCTSSAKNDTYDPANDPFVNSNEFFVSDIQVYPNPANDYVNLSFISAKETDVQVILSDILGKVVFTKKYNCSIGEEAARFQVNDLPKGTYFLQIIDENEILGVQKVSVL